MAVNKKYSPEQLVKLFEGKQAALTQSVAKDIITLFDKKANDVAFLYAKRRLIGNRFLPKDIVETIELMAKTIQFETNEMLKKAIRQTFLNAEKKNDLVETLAGGSGRKPPKGKSVATGLFGDEKKLNTAVDDFIKRKNDGLNLSKRVFKLSNSWKKTINDTLIEGLKNGTSARELAKDLKKAVRNGDNVKNPGTGVYRSPAKNALRLSRNEINLAYANADYERWQRVESIVGIEVKLSNRHPKYDVCDDMKGKYPKDFHFSKWHVNCLCIAVPILATRDERDKLQDYNLGLTAKKPTLKTVNDIPTSAKQWIINNNDRVNRWKSKPYWMQYNKNVVKDALKHS